MSSKILLLLALLCPSTLCGADSPSAKWHGVQIVDIGKADSTWNHIAKLIYLSKRNHKAATFRTNAEIGTDRGEGRSTVRYDRPTNILSIYAKYPVPGGADSNLTQEEIHHLIYSGVTDSVLAAALVKTSKDDNEGPFLQEFGDALIKSGCKKVKETYS